MEVPIPSVDVPALELNVYSIVTSSGVDEDGDDDEIRELTVTFASDVHGQFALMAEWPKTDVLVLSGAISLNGDLEQALNNIRLLRRKYSVILVSPGPTEKQYWIHVKAKTLDTLRAILDAEQNVSWDTKYNVKSSELVGEAILCDLIHRTSILGVSFHVEQRLPKYLSNQYTDLVTVSPDLDVQLDSNAHVYVSYFPPKTVRDAGLQKRPGDDVEVLCHRGTDCAENVVRQALRSRSRELVLYVASTPEDNWGITQCFLQDIPNSDLQDVEEASRVDFTANVDGEAVLQHNDKKVMYVANSSVIHGRYPQCALRPPIIVKFNIYPRVVENGDGDDGDDTAAAVNNEDDDDEANYHDRT